MSLNLCHLYNYMVTKAVSQPFKDNKDLFHTAMIIQEY